MLRCFLIQTINHNAIGRPCVHAFPYIIFLCIIKTFGDSLFTVKYVLGAEVLSQRTKFLPRKYEDLSVDSQDSKKLGMLEPVT